MMVNKCRIQLFITSILKTFILLCVCFLFFNISQSYASIGYREGLILGFLQGITEWLPISSSAQTLLGSFLFSDINIDQAFSIVIWLHLGSLLAVIVYLHRNIFDLLKNIFNIFKQNNEHVKLLRFLIVSTFFTAISGIPTYLFLKKIIIERFSSFLMLFMGVLLLITAILLAIGKIRDSSAKKDITFVDAVIVGLAQGVSILPGISRSGMCMAVLLWRGFAPLTVVRISFLMAVPSIVGALILEGKALQYAVNNPAVLVAIAITFVLSLAVMKVLMAAAHKLNFSKFCFFLGVLVILGAFWVR